MGTVFSSSDIRGRLGDSMTTETAWNAGKAFAEWLPEEGGVIVVRSEDANATVINGFIEGLLLQGRNVSDAGIGDQQTVVNALSEPQATGAALITHDNVQNLEIITLFDSNGVVITDEKGLLEIGELVDAGNFTPAPNKGEVKTL